MNILFFLTPKSDVAYISEDDTLRQALEKWSTTSIRGTDCQQDRALCGDADGKVICYGESRTSSIWI